MTSLIASSQKWFAPEPIPGGYRVRVTYDGSHYVDVLRTTRDWLLVLTPVEPAGRWVRGWFFGDGCRPGTPAAMEAAFLTALASAWLWLAARDLGEPPGHSRRARLRRASS